MASRDFWTGYQPGFRATGHEPGTPEFFAEIERRRYELEPHIPEMARFSAWRGKRVLDVGCGIATDGVRFARCGAAYTGVDRSPTALHLARNRFAAEGLQAGFIEADATSLPFDDGRFDLVWSNGVLHHVDRIDVALAEIHRVLKPGGRTIVMLYHRRSFNYLLTIMVVRRAFALLLLIPKAELVIAAVTREDQRLISSHRDLMREHGIRYVTDTGLFLSNNTDGPGNPLSRVYSAKQARQLFVDAGFGTDQIVTTVGYLNARLYPAGRWFEQTKSGHRVARRIGWHLYLEAVKAA